LSLTHSAVDGIKIYPFFSAVPTRRVYVCRNPCMAVQRVVGAALA
jgi:hypothetical protein